MALALQLIKKMPIIEGSEYRCQSAQRSYQSELRGDDINDEPELRLLRKREASFGFTLHVDERIARRETVRDYHPAGVRRVREVAELDCALERAARQIAASPGMSHPGQREQVDIGPRLEMRRPTSFDQGIADLTEATCGLIVAEAPSGDHGQVYIGDARSVAVAALEAEIDRSADSHGHQVEICKKVRRPHELDQDIESREGCRVGHQG